MPRRKRTDREVVQVVEKSVPIEQEHTVDSPPKSTQEELSILFQGLATGRIDAVDPGILSKYGSHTIEQLLSLQCDLHLEAIRKHAQDKSDEFLCQVQQLRAEITASMQ